MPEPIDLTNDGGVLKEIIREGEGDEIPSEGCTVITHYTGTLLDGTKFDSSLDRGQPFEFQLGKGQVIKAWDLGVSSMKKNEKCILTCAPNYAYGAAGSPPNIPPESTLKFELELLGWKGQMLGDDGGVEKFVLKKNEKNKKHPNEGALIKCQLKGTYEGRVFDERDIEFNLGEGEEDNVCSGIEVALLKMTAEETSRLVIQAKYAFGHEGSEQFKIPPNAIVEYVVSLNEFEKEVEAWKIDEKESIEHVKRFKEKGTKYFKEGKIKLALKLYKRCYDFFSNCDLTPEGEAKSLHLAVNLNIALCHQKLNDYDEVRHVCDTLLAAHPTNMKALFRRGQAFFALGEFDKALLDFEKSHEVEPDNKAVINQLALTRQKLKEYRDEEKKRYKNMFAKFAAVDGEQDKKDRELRDSEFSKATSFGEWKDEERSHSITKFEEENPDLIMCDNEITEELKNM